MQNFERKFYWESRVIQKLLKITYEMDLTLFYPLHFSSMHLDCDLSIRSKAADKAFSCSDLVWRISLRRTVVKESGLHSAKLKKETGRKQDMP